MPRWKTRFVRAGDILGRLERFLLPATCVLCAGSLGEERAGGVPLVCALCRSRWPRLPEPVCPRCGQPGGYGLPCRQCERWPAALGRVRSAVWLTGGARRVTHLLKYEGWVGAARAMAGAMRHLEPLTKEVFLVPIPLGARRQRARGYNQSAILADALGQDLGLRVDGAGLRRVRETTTQTALAPEARAANVAGAFQALGMKGRSVVLVDDVFTTGSTLVAAAQAVSNAGATAIHAITFARAVPPVA